VIGTRRAPVATGNNDPRPRWATSNIDPRARAERSRQEAMAAYWQQVEKALADVSYTRAIWRTELDSALKLLSQGKLVAGLAQAARIGRTYEASFIDHSRAVVNISAPEGAQRYHRLLLALLEDLAEANAQLARAATHRDLRLLAECSGFLRSIKQRLAELNRERDAIAERFRLPRP